MVAPAPDTLRPKQHRLVRATKALAVATKAAVARNVVFMMVNCQGNVKRMDLRMMVEVEVNDVFQVGCLLRTRGVPAFIDQKHLDNLLVGIPNSPNR